MCVLASARAHVSVHTWGLVSTFLQKFILVITKILRMVDATLYYLISKGGGILELFALNSPESWVVGLEQQQTGALMSIHPLCLSFMENVNCTETVPSRSVHNAPFVIY